MGGAKFFRRLFAIANCAVVLSAQAAPAAARDDVYAATLHRYDGPSVAGVDTSTLTGKVMCGYQGWFRCEGDGSSNDWHHYGAHGKFEPGFCGIDLWPDVSELGPSEKFPTGFRFADGSVASVFSSVNAATVRRHFDWMRAAGIDGVFVQRFIGTTHDPRFLGPVNTVLTHCRDAANQTGRAWALMYDLSGMRAGGASRIISDWQQVVNHLGAARDANDHAYLHHRGKPVVALWGLGFNDREPLLDEWRRLLEFFKHDPEYGQCTVFVGVPTGWRTLTGDSIRDPQLHEVIALADIVSPWAVGRFATPDAAARHGQQRLAPDLAWCRDHKLEYLPVVFPGFSWHNLMQGRGRETKSNQIPRLGGRFFWSQCVAAQRAGAAMLYVAMFDEMDEGTAIFKCVNQPPVGASPFVSYDGVPADHYLWLAGQAGRLLRGELAPTDDLPKR